MSRIVGFALDLLGGPPSSFGLETNADATLQIVGTANVCIDFADLMGFVGILALSCPKNQIPKSSQFTTYLIMVTACYQVANLVPSKIYCIEENIPCCFFLNAK